MTGLWLASTRPASCKRKYSWKVWPSPNGAPSILRSVRTALSFVAHLLNWMRRAAAFQTQINRLEAQAVQRCRKAGPQERAFQRPPGPPPR